MMRKNDHNCEVYEGRTEGVLWNRSVEWTSVGRCGIQHTNLMHLNRVPVWEYSFKDID